MTTYEELLSQGREDERPLVRVDRADDRAIVTLADPVRLNALSPALVLQLQDHLAALADDAALRAVVITGDGRSFSAGGDLDMIDTGARAIQEASEPADTVDAWRWIRRQFGGVVRSIAASEKAFIAALNGPAAGVGLAFALACDIVVASERATIVPAFGRLGLVPEVGMSWFLTRRVGYQRALSLYVEGRHLGADEALRLGLVTEVCAHEQLLATADRWCDRITRLPKHAFEMTKPLLRSAADMPWEQALTLEEYAEANCFSTATLPDAAAGIRAGAPLGTRPTQKTEEAPVGLTPENTAPISEVPRAP